MASNDKVILERILKERKDETASGMSDSDFFEIFTAEQILKNLDLSYEEIQSGLVRGSHDGGIDSVYTLINGELVSDDNNFGHLKSNIDITLHIIQSKISSGYTEEALNKLIASTNDLLNLDNPLEKFHAVYNSKLLNNIKNFQKNYLDLSGRLPKLTIAYYYATQGDSDNVHSNVERKVKCLEEALCKIFSDIQFSFKFIGARELLTLARQSRVESLQLQVTETPISTGKKIASICLVTLKDYYHFITDSSGELRRGIFEANVRDYQGSVEVNKAIKQTLEKEDSGEEDFWWLNNGITIVASSSSQSGKTLTLTEVQIVNGLQTSMEIYHHFRDLKDESDLRNILVRVIVPPNENSRNSIIKATNSQTNIPPASLRATDRIQSDIEQYFETKGLYYDRRKNYHKNLGRPMDKIISIPYLAQAVMAIVLQEPNNSRGRPSSLIKDDKNYSRVFTDKYPIELYIECVKLMKTVDAFLKSDTVSAQVSDNSSNVRFQLAMFAAAMKSQKSPIPTRDILKVGLSDIDFDYLQACLPHVWKILENLRETQKVDGDRIAKSNDFDEALKERINKILTGEMDFVRF